MFSKPLIKDEDEQIEPESDQEQNNITNIEPNMTEVML